MNKMSLLTLRYMKHNMRRTITTILVAVVSTMLIYMIFTGGYNAFESITRNSLERNLMWEAAFNCDKATAEEIVNKSGYYNDGESVLDVDKAFYIGGSENYGLYINDFSAMPMQFELKNGRLPVNENEIIVSDEAVQEEIQDIEYKVGEYITVVVYDRPDLDDEAEISEDSIKRRKVSLLVTGIYRNLEYREGGFNFGYNDVITTGDMSSVDEESFAQLYLTFSDKNNIEKQAMKLANAYGISEYTVNTSAKQYYSIDYNNSDVTYLGVNALLLFLAAIAALCGMLIVRNAFNISVHERNNDYGILRCIGLNRKQIIRLILLEGLVVVIIGAGLGILLGHGITTLGFNLINMSMENANLSVRCYGKAVALTLVYSVVMVCYAMISPIEKLYKLSPIDAMTKAEEYKEKKLKAGRGSLLYKIFGFETSYAYKNIMRRKGRFFINVATLSICVLLFVGINNSVYNFIKYMRSELISYGEYDGAFVIYNYDDIEALDMWLESEADIKSKTIICTIEGNKKIVDDEDSGNEEDTLNEETVEETYSLNRDCYIGVDEATFDSLVFNADIKAMSEDESVINLLKVGDNRPAQSIPYIERAIGESFNIVDNKTEYEFCIAGLLKKEDLLRVAKSLSDKSVGDNMVLSIESENSFYVFPISKKFTGFKVDNMESIFSSKPSVTYDSGCLSEVRYFIDLKDNYDRKQFLKKVDKLGFVYNDYTAEYRGILDKYNAIKYVVTMFVIIFLLIFVLNSINVNMADVLVRKEEFEILEYIGLSNKQKRKIISSESTIVTIVALLFGSVGGVLASKALFKLFLYEEEITIKFAINFIYIIIAAVTLVGISIISRIFSSKQT